MRLLSSCLLLLPLAWPAQAAEPPTGIAAVIDLARAAPGEFAADALLRLAALDTIDKPKRVALIEEAFSRAADAQQPLKKTVVVVRGNPAARFLNQAYGQDLDALSLRLRAVQAMLPLDARKARALFTQIPPLAVPKLSCTDSMAYDVDRFYEALGVVAHASFSVKEIEKGEPFQFVNQYALTITSPAQIAPITAMLSGLGDTPGIKDADFRALVSSFAGAMEKISGDDRAFTATEAGIGPKVAALVSELQRRNVSPLPLIEAYRVYLVNHLAGERCADDDLTQTLGLGNTLSLTSGQALDGQAASVIAFFNEHVRQAPLQKLSETETTPARIAGTATAAYACDDEDCKTLVAGYGSLLISSSGQPFTEAQRQSSEWAGKLQQFLASVAAWKPAAGDGLAGQFRAKCEIYTNLTALAPPGPRRETVLLDWLDYLQQNRFAMTDRIQWFLPVNQLIGRVQIEPVALAKVAEVLREVRDPVIALYVELEAIAPRSPDRIISLL